MDLVARVQRDNGTVGLEHTQSYPGLTLVADGGKRPSFRVLDAGDPVKNAKVTVAGQSGTTGSDGRVVIPVDQPGGYTARATAPKYVGASASVTAVATEPSRSDLAEISARGWARRERRLGEEAPLAAAAGSGNRYGLARGRSLGGRW